MPKLSLLPPGKDFYGMFETPGLTTAQPGNTMLGYENWNFADVQSQIDAALAAGANLYAYFGDVAWYTRGIITLNQYLAHLRERLDYLQKVGMYGLIYVAPTFANWFKTTNDDFCKIILPAVAALVSSYSNSIGLITMDEPYSETGLDNTVGNAITAQYLAAKAVVPSDFPIAASPNPCGTYDPPPGSSIFECTGQHAVYAAAVDSINDFWVFHPLHVVTLEHSAALRSLYPNKEIIMSSSCDVGMGRGNAADIINGVMGLVGANNFRGMAYFPIRDFTGDSGGYFDASFVARPDRAGPFTANLSGAVDPLDFHAAIDATFNKPVSRQNKQPVEAEAMASKALPEGVHIPDDVVQITGGPRSIQCALDATNYVDGTQVACALQLLFSGETEWQTAFSFTVNRRGPADEWHARMTTPFPLPDCQARVVTIVKGAELTTKATIRW